MTDAPGKAPGSDRKTRRGMRPSSERIMEEHGNLRGARVVIDAILKDGSIPQERRQDMLDTIRTVLGKCGQRLAALATELKASGD
jgi:hypothetical protein